MEVACPACGSTGRYGRHGFYWKYHYDDQIWILRVRCRRCGVTHAVIPSFSLPGTSIGTREAERYLIARAEGVSRGQAARGLLARGLKEGYPKALERMLEVAISRGKMLFPAAADPEASGLAWVEALCGATSRPLLSLNQYALEHGVNALCFCRASILVFGRNRIQDQISHNQGSAAAEAPLVDSG